MAAQPPNSAGCTPCTTTPVVVAIPGPQGAAGSNGTNGTDGATGYTDLLDDFVMPADASSVNINVTDGSFLPVYDGVNASVYVYVEGAGYFLVTAVVAGIGYYQVTIYNESFPENAAPGTLIVAGAKVGVGGPRGPVAAITSPAPAPYNATYVLQTANATLTSAQVLASLGSGFVKVTTTTGVLSSVSAVPVADVSGSWPLGSVTGTLAIANGGTGGTTQTTARTALGLGSIATQSASAVAITGGTISGLTITVPILQITQSIDLGVYADTTGVLISFNTVTYDPSAAWNAGSFRYLPPQNGYYMVTIEGSVFDSAAPFGFLAIRKNGTVIFRDTDGAQGTTANTTSSYTSGIIQITNTGTDYIDFAVVRSSGSGAETVKAGVRATIIKVST
jgi:hypothetical protein